MSENFLPRIFPTASRLRHHYYVHCNLGRLGRRRRDDRRTAYAAPAASFESRRSVDQIRPLSPKTGHYQSTRPLRSAMVKKLPKSHCRLCGKQAGSRRSSVSTYRRVLAVDPLQKQPGYQLYTTLDCRRDRESTQVFASEDW